MCKKCLNEKPVNKHGYCRGCFNQIRAIGKVADTVMSPNVSREKTLEQFGYDPLYLSHQSGMKVVKICPQCGKEKIFRKQAANKDEWCIACRGQERFIKFHEAQIQYKTPEEKGEAHRKNNRNSFSNTYIPKPRRKGMSREEANKKLNASRKQKRLEDLVYRVRMSVTSIINQYLRRKEIGRKKKGNTLKNIGIEKEDLRQHVAFCLDKGCIICGQPIYDRWHLAHLKPLAQAKTVDDVYASFQLHNLAVAHPRCNLSTGPREFKPFYETQKNITITGG
jgi:hypothetical protein